MFRAKSVYSIEELNYHEVPHEEGYVKGWLVNKFIVGDINFVDGDNEVNVKFWSEIDLSTIEYLGLENMY